MTPHRKTHPNEEVLRIPRYVLVNVLQLPGGQFVLQRSTNYLDFPMTLPCAAIIINCNVLVMERQDYCTVVYYYLLCYSVTKSTNRAVGPGWG